MNSFCGSCGISLMSSLRFCPGCGWRKNDGSQIDSPINYVLANSTTYSPISTEIKDEILNVAAGNGPRLLAYLIDASIISVFSSVMSMLINFIFFQDLFKMWIEYFWFSIIFSSLFLFMYSVLFHCSRYKATIGKMILGLIVVTNDNKRLSFMHSLGRTSLHFLLYFLISFALTMILSSNVTIFYPNVLLAQISFLLCMVVGWWLPCITVFFDPQHRTLMDRICKTKVIKKANE